MKKSLAMLLTVVLSCVFVSSAYAEEDNRTSDIFLDNICKQLDEQAKNGDFCVAEGDLYVTGCVLVIDGRCYVLSEKEYLDYREMKGVEKEQIITKENIQNLENNPRSIDREFIPSRKTVKNDENKMKRVTAIFNTAGLDSVSVTNIYNFTRTCTTSQGVSLSAKDLGVIDAEVSASYSLSKSASSSTSESVTGVYSPSGKYSYMAVVFVPSLATVTGTYKVYANIMGCAEVGSYNCTLVYPVTNGRIFDGEYRRYESNSKSDFPKLAS